MEKENLGQKISSQNFNATIYLIYLKLESEKLERGTNAQVHAKL